MATWDPEQYEAQLAQGLALSGEDAGHFAGERALLVRTTCDRLQLAPRRIGEFGSGLGTNLGFLAAVFPDARLLGLDASQEMVDAARVRHGGPRIDLQLDSDYGGEGELDLVFVNGVLHHVEPPDRAAVMARLHALVRPGGLLALFDNNPLNPGAMWVMRRIPFDRDASPVLARTLCRLATDAGFLDVTSRSHFYFPGPLRAFRPIEKVLTRIPLGAQYVVYGRRGEAGVGV